MNNSNEMPKLGNNEAHELANKMKQKMKPGDNNYDEVMENVVDENEAHELANKMKQKMKPGDNNYDEVMENVVDENEINNINKERIKDLLRRPDFKSKESIVLLAKLLLHAGDAAHSLFNQAMNEIDAEGPKNFDAEQKVDYASEGARYLKNLSFWRSEAYHKAWDLSDEIKNCKPGEEGVYNFEIDINNAWHEYMYIEEEQSICDKNLEKLKAEFDKGTLENPLEFGKFVHKIIYDANDKNSLNQYLFFLKAEELWHEKHSEDFVKIKPILDLAAYRFIKEVEQKKGKSKKALTILKNPDTKGITFPGERLQKIYSNDPIARFRDEKWKFGNKPEMGFTDEKRNDDGNVSHVIGTSLMSLNGLLSNFKEKK